MRYLVTGGAGFIGSALTARLLDAGHEVCVLHREEDPHRLRNLACDSLRGDIRDLTAVSQAAKGCDAIAHLAYVQRAQGNQYANSREVLDVAVRGMATVLDVCETHGINDLMLVSSPEVYDAEGVVPETVPLTVPDVLDLSYSHGGGKIASELMAAAWARSDELHHRLIVARPHNVYGPDMGAEHVIPQFCKRMKRLASVHPDGIIPFPIRGPGETVRSFCYISDCTDQLMLLMDRAPALGIYHVGTAEECTIADVARAVAAFFGREIAVQSGPEDTPSCRLPDLSHIRDLGYDPSQAVTFASGIRSTASWYWTHA